MKRVIFLAGLLSFCNVYPNTPNEFWQSVSDDGLHQTELASKSLDQSTQIKKRNLRLNETGLKEYLTAELKQDVSGSLAAKPTQKQIELPLPNDEFVRVKVIDTSILSKEMMDRYPDIHTWKVKGVDDPAISGRIDFSTNGFHGMLTLANGDTVYIDPDSNHLSGLYNIFSKNQNHEHFKTDFACKVHDLDNLVDKPSDTHIHASPSAKISAAAPSQNLITYRLALAGTGEYTQSQGGTSSKAYASMVTTINRVNEIYQRDLGVKLQLVSDETIVYNNSSSDPYTNNSAMALVSENIENLNNIVGPENYDIGHVFAQGSLGGLAFAASACQENYKAGGATGTPTPNGETFSVEYVAHELGHQLGATHTFNSEQRSCSGNNRVQQTAVEPGSGSTIMSYSGLCGTDNIQTVSDAVFHWVSINQITEYTNNATGNSCGIRTTTNHDNLSVDAKEDLNIPANTPFILKGAESGGVSFSWDQFDTGAASLVTEDLGENAIIRSLLPNSDTTRYIPSLMNLFEGTTIVGETLPKTNRDLNFAFSARGEKGGIATDFKKLSVTDSGSVFKVFSHSSPQILQKEQKTFVEWDVAGTDVLPINCKDVVIKMIRSNGVENILMESTANDGSESITIPSSIPDMQDARIMVACNNNSFFNISSANLTIEEGFGDRSLEASGGGSLDSIILYLLLLKILIITSLNLNSFTKREL